jgi:hypothetical protein
VSNQQDFIGLLHNHGSDAIYHRSESVIPCPCLTPEGFRDPEWHDANPSEPVCDERGFLHDPNATTEITVKAFVQPSQTTRATRMAPEYLQEMFGEIQQGDHIGIFPCVWNGVQLEFYDWSQNGEDWLFYNGRNYMVVAANLFAAPDTGAPRHHWEVGLRLMSEPLNG